VRRPALVRAGRLPVAGLQLGHDVLAGQVVARRDARLEEQQRPVALGHQLAVELDPDVARAAPGVDAVERVARMGEDRLVLLEPLVEGREVEHHVARQVLVGGPEGGRLERRAGRAQVERLAVGGVGGEGDPGMEDRSVGGHRPGRAGHELGADVLDRDGVQRHDAARLPDQQRARAVDHRLTAERGPDALLDRLMAQLPQPLHHRVAHPRAHRRSVTSAARR
jgi:hypothetical protein